MRLDQQVQGFGRPAAHGLEIEVFEDIEHQHECDAAGARRRRPIDVVAAEGAVDGFAGLGPVGGEVVLGDQAVARLHLRHELAGDGAGIEGVGPSVAIKRSVQARSFCTRRSPACQWSLPWFLPQHAPSFRIDSPPVTALSEPAR